MEDSQLRGGFRRPSLACQCAKSTLGGGESLGVPELKVLDWAPRRHLGMTEASPLATVIVSASRLREDEGP